MLNRRKRFIFRIRKDFFTFHCKIGADFLPWGFWGIRPKSICLTTGAVSYYPMGWSLALLCGKHSLNWIPKKWVWGVDLGRGR